ncbi:MAG TPA: hypothetical protein VNO14_03825 [Blastocatellia bacterium]|nr:hypothetical protein [Blastocatellia bacterium]
MKTIRTILMAILALGLISAAINPNVHAASGPQDQDPSTIPMTSIAPPSIFPDKEVFTVREGDSIVVVVNATCLYQGEGETGFEFLSSTPEFVRLSPVYRSENREKEYVSGLAVIRISPQIGDAGKYEVGVMARACDGMVERLIHFKVKVKRAR